MAEPDIFVIVDEVLGFIEPDTAIAKDPARSRPVTYIADTVYVYPDAEEHTRYESGDGVRQDFTIIVDLSLDDTGEHAAGERDTDVTTALRTRVKAMAERVRTNQRSALHDQLRVARIEWQAINGLEIRGVRMRLAGYRLWN